MISRHISRASAIVLMLGGVAMLFASDVILPRIIPGFPPTGAWVGQLLGAAWLALAALNWLGQSVLLGGIYGRPQVMTNVAVYFISTTSLARIVTRADGSAALWILTVICAVFASVYGWLLFRGPFERDLEFQRHAR